MKWNKQAVAACICMAVLQWIATGCAKQEPTDRLPGEGVLSFSLMLSDPQSATRALESKNSTLQKAAKKSDPKAVPIPIYTYTKLDGLFSTYFTDGLVYGTPDWETSSGAIRFSPEGGMYLFSYYGTEQGDLGDLSKSVFTPPSGAAYPKLTHEVHYEKREIPHQVDLIACKLEDYRSNHVKLPFRHILSQINFGVKGMSDFQISVFNIRVNNVFKKGTFDYGTWNWTPSSDLDNDIASFDYYFPDWKDDFYQNSGLKYKRGENYITAGGADDSNNIYIFGDGGGFGPDARGVAHWYAQLSGANGYKQRNQSSKDIANSLMLLPQKISQNLSASVTFDYVIKKNGVVVKQENGREILLSHFGIDWEPNMRYVYLFQFDLPADYITFDVELTPWENWDGSSGNGLKNGTIQEPTQTTLNAIGDGEIIYLNGILERNFTGNLKWNWSDETKYMFTNVNFLDLDFAGVNMGTYEVEVAVPPGFTVTTSPASNTNRRLKIERDVKQLFMPTDKQIGLLTDKQMHKLYGSLTGNTFWDWSGKNLTSLGDGMSCTLNFSDVAFSGYTLSLNLPAGYTATPSTINSNIPITIKNEKTYPVEEPDQFLREVMSQGGKIDVKGGAISSATTWNWSAANAFLNLSPQQHFTLAFTGVSFDGNVIRLNLPTGFRASGTKVAPTDVANYQYEVTDNGDVTIKNNRIEYPSPITMNGVYNGASVALVGEKISSDPDVIDWTTGGITFPNLFPQTSFTLDLTKVNYINTKNIKVQLPALFDIIAGSYSGTNPCIFATAQQITIKNNAISEPTTQQISAMINGGSFNITGGKLISAKTWDWSQLQMLALGGNNNTFTMNLSGIDFYSHTIAVKLPAGISATGHNVTLVSGNEYKIANNTTVGFIDRATSLPASNAEGYHDIGGLIENMANGQVLILVGVNTGRFHLYNSTFSNLTTGQSVKIDLTRVQFSNLEVWAWGNSFSGYTITATNGELSLKTDEVFVLSAPCVVTITKR